MEGGADAAGRIQIKGALDAAPLEGLFEFIEFPVFKERILGDAQFDAFGLHDVDRVVEQRQGQIGRFLGQKHLRLRLRLQQNRQRPHMVEMGMGDDRAIDAAVLQHFVMRDGLGSLVLRVHARVQHDPGSGGFEQIGIRADFGVATETLENHEGLD